MWMKGGGCVGWGGAFKASRWQSVSPSTFDCKLQHFNTATLPFVRMYSMKMHSRENKGRNMKLLCHAKSNDMYR